MAKDYRAPRRKKHRNSKLGCATCKRRRVKCSESLPECTNCVKHGSRCEYLDYSEEQLEEFKKAKQELIEHHATHRPRSIDITENSVEILPNESTPVPLARPQKSQSVSTQIMPTLSRPTLSGIPFSSPSLSYPGAQPAGQSRVPISLEPSTNVFESDFIDDFAVSVDLRDQVQPVPYQSGVTQDFDDLLTEQDHQIIYPVYSFRNSVESRWSYNSSSVVSSAPRESGSDIAEEDSSDSYVSEDRDETTSNCGSQGTCLPQAIQGKQTFEILQPHDMDYDTRFYQIVGDLGPLITQGKAQLQQIRELYHLWLGHFFFKAFESSIMFSCLTNLTTNYLITNVFRSSRLNSLCTATQMEQSRKSLLNRSIQHYAAVIKSLRSLLNRNTDPQLASSVSYILSLMSIYDPEATVNSTVCFRDGMFSVLSYTLQLSKNKEYSVPIFIPIHMQLASNIVRTVYLPAYNPEFLNEYEGMLHRLGSVIGSVGPAEVSNKETFDFIVDVFEDLYEFCQESIKVHIPTVNNNLANIPLQLDVLFQMFRKWANLGPSRLLTVSRSTDPLEKVLNLFFRLFRKAVYAVVPQVKFCFLRDFDSPLMLDVFPNSCDASVLDSLDTPEKLCLVPEAYSRILNELKILSAYAIRVITFTNLRIAVLYRNLVYNEKVRRLYPIDNIVDWKDSITDIHATRTEFQERIGLREVCIEKFNSTNITQLHYPRVVESEAPDDFMESAEDGDQITVDLLSLQPNGLLEDDELPFIGA